MAEPHDNAKPFMRHQDAALAYLASGHCRSRRNGIFAGQLVGDPKLLSLSPKQTAWLTALLLNAGLPPLADGGDDE